MRGAAEPHFPRGGLPEFFQRILLSSLANRDERIYEEKNRMQQATGRRLAAGPRETVSYCFDTHSYIFISLGDIYTHLYRYGWA